MLLHVSTLDDLPVAPGMSGRLKLNQNNQNRTPNDFDTNTTLDDEWAEDVGGIWNDEVPEIVNQSDSIPELIPDDEINHIKVIISNR